MTGEVEIPDLSFIMGDKNPLKYKYEFRDPDEALRLIFEAIYSEYSDERIDHKITMIVANDLELLRVGCYQYPKPVKIIVLLKTHNFEVDRILVEMGLVQYFMERGKIPLGQMGDIKGDLSEVMIHFFWKNGEDPLDREDLIDTTKLNKVFRDPSNQFLWDLLVQFPRKAINRALIRSGWRELSYDHSANVLSLMDAGKYNVTDILRNFKLSDLQTVAIKRNVRVLDDWDAQVEEILHPDKGIDKGPANKVKAGTDGFDGIEQAVISWTPLTQYKFEEGYTGDLARYLVSKGHLVEFEMGDSAIDLLIDGEVPIEMKRAPTGSELDRAFGQLTRHLEIHKALIVIICAPQSQESVDDFRNRISKFVNHPDYKHRVIAK
jgi:hypothetical protein